MVSLIDHSSLQIYMELTGPPWLIAVVYVNLEFGGVFVFVNCIIFIMIRAG